MKLPPDYLDVVRAGAEVLGSLGAEVRREADNHPEKPELWLTVRDYEGLAARLAWLDDWLWREGFGDMGFTGQDIGVIDEVLTSGSDRLVPLSEAQRGSLARLKTFLEQYRDGKYDLAAPPPNERGK